MAPVLLLFLMQAMAETSPSEMLEGALHLHHFPALSKGQLMGQSIRASNLMMFDIVAGTVNNSRKVRLLGSQWYSLHCPGTILRRLWFAP